MSKNYKFPEDRLKSAPGRNCLENPTGAQATSSSFLRASWLGILFVLLSLVTEQGMTAQTITLGSGSTTSGTYPVYPYYGFSYSQQIVLKSEINVAGNITKIRFYRDPNSLDNTSNNWTIYMGHTSKATFANNTDWILSGAMSQVFSGTVTSPAVNGWMEIELTAPFAYNNINNLVIAVDENAASFIDSSLATYFRVYSAGANRSIYYSSDSVNPNPATMTSSSVTLVGSRATTMNQMQLVLPVATDVSTTAINAIPVGNCPGTAVPVSVTIKNEGTNALNFATTNATINVAITGASTQSLTATVNTGTLASGASQTVNVTPNAAFTAVGTHTVTATVTLTGDGNSANNSTVVSKVVTASTTSPYSESFTAASLPTGWATTGTSGTGFSFGTAHGVTTNGIYKNIYNTAISGQFNTMSVGPVAATDELKFDYRVLNYVASGYPGSVVPPTGDWGNFKVQISSDCGVTFSDLQTINNTNHTKTDQTWTAKTYSLASYSGQYVLVRILATWVSGDYYLDFDNFSIAPPPACTAVTGVTVTKLTATTASVSWTGGGNAIVEWGTSGCTAGSAATAGACGNVAAIGTSPRTITGLTGGTTYSVYVRKDCTASSNGYSTNSTVSYLQIPSCPENLGAGTVTVAMLPYSVTSHTTCGNGNNLTSANVATVGASSGSYFGGEDKTYIFTPTVTGIHTITMVTGSSQSAGLMLYQGCPFTSGSTVVAYAQASTGTSRVITPTLTSGVTYYLVADNFPSPSCLTTYSLTIAVPSAPSCATGQVPATTATGVVRNSSLTWNTVSGATSYDVYFGTSSTPAFIGNQSTLTYTPPVMAAGTLYYWKIVPKNAIGDAAGCTTLSFTTGTTLTYCTASYSSGCGVGADAVTNVTLGTLNNSTGCSSGAYTFYSALTVPNIYRSSTATVSVSVGSHATQYVGVWIDYNQNGTFEASEGVVSANIGASGTIGMVVSVPVGAVLGQTRMRVRGGDDSALATSNGCGSTSSSWGETEDYIVNVGEALPPTQCVTLNSPTNGANVTMTAGAVTISWTAPASGPVATSYDVYLGTVSGSLTLIGNTAFTSVNITNLVAATTYYWSIVAKSATGSDATGCSEFSFTTNNPFAPYCGSIDYTESVEPITLVNFAGINNTSSNVIDGSQAIENFTAITGNVMTGSSYTITIKGNTAGNYVDNLRVFIDWNQDGAFVAAERYNPGNLSNTDGTDAVQATLSILVPTTALAGTTRMRIKKLYSDDDGVVNNSCTGGQFGQTEDYSLNVCIPTTWYQDLDADGFGNLAVTQSACAQPSGYVSNSTDCNDNQTRYADVDLDGFGSATVKVACGGVLNNTDCNDNETRYADVDLDGFGSATVKVACGGVLNNTDCNDAVTYYSDGDNDGFGALPKLACGTITTNTDCDDAVTYYTDGDNDGFGALPKLACGTITTNTDCDDAVTYYTDGDNDGFGALPKLACGTVTDNTDCNDAVTYFTDADGDGFGVLPKLACGTVTNSLDCNDAQLLYTDVDGDGFGSDTFAACTGVANTDDCNDAQLLYTDVDADGFGSDTFAACTGVTNTDDCDDNLTLYTDNDADGFGVLPKVACGGAANVSDCDDGTVRFADNDADGFGSLVKVACDGVTNSSDCNDNLTLYTDADGDTYGALPKVACGGVTNNTDCNDTKASVHPFATEIGYNLIDDDCDGSIDEGFPPKTTVITGPQCNTVLPTIDSQVIADVVGGAQGYQWRITTMSGPDIGQVQLLNTSLRVMKISQLGTYAYQTTYKVEVAVYYAGFLQPYTPSTCTVTTPEGLTKLTTCGQTLTSTSNVIYANIVPYATGYRFKITDPITPTNTQVIVRSVREFRMNLITAFVVQYGKTYNVEVSVKNTNGIYMNYGGVCTVATPVFPTTSIVDEQCEDYAPATMNVPIYAYSYPAAIAYGFNLSGNNFGTAGVEVVKSTRTFKLSDFTGLISGASYNVRVRLIFNTTDTAGPYGKPCTVNVPSALRLAELPFEAKAYPNPFADNFSIDVTTSAQENIVVKVYDMTGRLLETRNVQVAEMESLKVGDRFPAGVYNVIVSQGVEVKTLRVVKR